MNHRVQQTRTDYPVPTAKWSDPLIALFLRAAASGLVPGQWFLKNLPAPESRTAKTGKLHLEIVSHCWNYAHFLIYQLSSLVNYPPGDLTVTMAVYYCPEDLRTKALLDNSSRLAVPGVIWDWRPLPRQALFRRAIGRNQAALHTRADWIWFTDCDLMFRNGCLDSLAAVLQGRQDALVFPATERCTALLSDDNPLLHMDTDRFQVLDVDARQFTERKRTRATGPLQISHGDVARACGYCNSLPYYQRPSLSWCKAHEDRAYRWLLGTQGTPLDIRGVYRIRHAAKGRYTGNRFINKLRGWIRRLVSSVQER
ncbi:MAG: glycosyltransferase family A protein [Pseudohongiellaceae bacterium]